MTQAKSPPPWHTVHYLPTGAASVLDIGCNDGASLQWALELGVRRLYGVDINPAAVEAARTRLKQVVGCQIIHGSADSLPWDDHSIEAALCCEVLEHIPTELRGRVIREVHRVLRPGALLVISVPAAGMFSFLDPANIRFRMPILYRAASRAFGGRGREAGYRDQKHGVVPHHHFSLQELRVLLDPYFRVERVRWRGFLLAPISSWMAFPFYRLGALDHPLLKAIHRVENWEMSLDLGERFAYNVVLTARRMEIESSSRTLP